MGTVKFLLFSLLACSATASLAQPVMKRCIYFDTDKAELKDESMAILKKLEDTLRTFRSFEIQISGNTDAVGDSLYNITLSQKRTQAVYDYFRTGKMCGCKLKTEFAGENRPIADNLTDLGRQRNRRVEIYVYVPAQKR